MSNLPAVPVDQPDEKQHRRTIARTLNAVIREEGLPHRWNAVNMPWSNTVPLTASVGALTGNLLALKFDSTVTQETQFVIRLPNSYAQGSNLYPVICWAPVDANGGHVIWGMEYALGKPGAAFTSATAIEITSTAGGALVYTLANLPVISGSGLEIGTLLFGRVYRKAAAAGDDYSSNAIFLAVDIDVETDTRGSYAQQDKWQAPVELEPVPSYRVPLVFDDIQPHIKEILDLNLNRISADDLYLELLERKMQLWLIKRGKKVLMVGVTVIRVYPDCKAANVIGISGTDIDSWMRFEPDLIKWAKGEGCIGIDVVARKGWLRKLQGWKELGVVMTRPLGD